MKLLIGVLIAIALTSCEPNELSPAFPIGGGAIPAGGGAAPAARPLPAAPPNQKMIDNPDAQSENDSEEVWATDQADAERKCQQIAANRSGRDAIVSVQGVQQITRTLSRSGTYRFVCQLRVEHQ